jgi:hypothetical protein
MRKIVIPAILAATILVVGMFAFFPVQNLAFADNDKHKKADFALFTTEDTGTADDYVTCSSKGVFELHVAVTNYEDTTQTLQIVFNDGDLVNYFVPAGGSFSFTQVAGTNPAIDGTIKIDPQDQDGDVSPIVGWVSADGDKKTTCDVTTFNPIP